MSEMKLILGLGKTGVSCANYFNKHNMAYRVFDSRDESELDQTTFTTLDSENIFFNNFDKNLFDDIDEIIVSPGFDRSHEIFREIRFRKIPCITDIDLFKKHCKKPIISVTGTNGKTTIVSMLEHVLLNIGIKAIACGNNGIPPLDVNSSNYDYIILELSSYQLEYMHNHQSFISLLANIDHDHFERHKTMEEYLGAKLKIFSSCDYPIINVSLLNTSFDIDKTDLIRYGLLENKIIISNKTVKEISYDYANIYYKDRVNLKHKGLHNLENIIAICSIVSLLGIRLENCLDSLKSYIHLPHRIEFVKNSKGISWYNDSKSTNSASTKAALKYINSNIILILGGAMKNMDYRSLSDLINQKVRILVFIGENKDYIKNQINVKSKIIDAKSIDDAVILSRDIALANDTILLSPASPSFDMFKNFEDRGEAFKKAVKEYVD